jgi:hypothetical protein
MNHNMLVWKTLEGLLIELRKNIQIPANILEDLRAARSMIELSNNKAAPKETLTKTETYLTTVEAYLIDQAQKTFEPNTVNEWLKRLKEANLQVVNKETGTSKNQFVTGIPHGQQWIRIETDDKLPEDYILKLARESHLTADKQTDGHLVIHGQLNAIKMFIKQITAKQT